MILSALFASSSLVTIQMAILVMALTLVAGVFGRVTAMWISAVIMRDRPVLHRVAKHQDDASVFMEAVLRKEGIVCEVMGHAVIAARCVKRNPKWTWSALLGVLARAFDVSKIAVRALA